jgi:hypothetical protein
MTTTQIGGLPFWTLAFDADGDPDSDLRRTFLNGVRENNLTDVIIFAHGWNNDRTVAMKLFTGFFKVLAGQIRQNEPGGGVSVGTAGVIWPARRWSDEPIPDFDPLPASGGGVEGGASLSPITPVSVTDPRLDQQTLDDLCDIFPAGRAELDQMAELLESRPTAQTLKQFHSLMKAFADKAGVPDDDGEDVNRPDHQSGSAEPAMLIDEPNELFLRFRDTLQQTGVGLDDAPGGEAGLGDAFRGIMRGAKEALRQLTYWQMKNRAGVVGRNGLGTLIGQLHEQSPNLRVHLVGHSFGARLVSYALAGLPNGLDPSPVKAVTLLQGAFSHFAFAEPLPFDANRKGALAGMLQRIDGPLTVCYSKHDSAVGVFYPLASMAARDDSAAAQGALYRWGAMGANGAQGVQAKVDAIQPATRETTYRFAAHQALNIDAADIVQRGGPPSGAHSDIIHPELSWVVLIAGGLAP